MQGSQVLAKVGSGGRPPSILIVEDEFLVAMELASVVQGGGWNVLGPASSVGEAMLLLDRETPDAALLDYNLRGQPVTPVAERLHAMGVPFAVVSAYAASNITQIDVLANSPILQKPALPASVAMVVSGLIQKDQAT
jgi:DNA-binding response OmpR family regulator